MIFGADVTTTILIALIPVTFTLVCGLIGWFVKRLGILMRGQDRNDLRLDMIEKQQHDILEKLNDHGR